MSVLEVHDVSIRYITGDFKDIGLKEYTMKKLKGEYHVTEFWADRNISFTLEKGEMLGIIGANGAGKSTLLKAVSGIMEPTTGSVKREGNIAALLELASGFDGDLTVRENAYLRGAMLGYTRKFMDETYDQIIDFAGLRDFQDRPFRQLSSGMKSRLAFSIASLVQPDILILDEVLSVGDGAFRKKSEEKMREIIAGGAATILVSHSIQQVRSLCTKVLWLDHGYQVALSNDVDGVCNLYQKFLNKEIGLEEAKRLAHDGEESKKRDFGKCVEIRKSDTQKSNAVGVVANKEVEKHMGNVPPLKNGGWGFSIALGVFLLSLIVFPVLITTILYIFHIPITAANLALALVAALIALYVTTGGDCGKTAITALVGILLAAIAVVLCMHVYDWTWDGNTYHKCITGLLRYGWNPLYETFYDYGGATFPFMAGATETWYDAYPKGSEIWGACVYIICGDIESGKAFNLISMLGSFFACFGLLGQTGKVKPWQTALCTFFCIVTPISLSQCFTYYNDGFLWQMVTVCLATLLYLTFYEQGQYRRICAYLVFLTINVGLNIKFSALIFFGILGMTFFAFWSVERLFTEGNTPEAKHFIRKRFVLLATSALSGVLVTGATSYVINTLRHKNPVYTMIGDDAIKIFPAQLPLSQKEMSNIERFISSLFSRTNGSKALKTVEWKIPFFFDGGEYTAAQYVDARMAGWGIFFSGLLLVGVAVLLWWLKSGKTIKKAKKTALVLLTVYFVSLFLVPGLSWARYNVALFYIPVAGLFFLFAGEADKKSGASFCLAGAIAAILALNMVPNVVKGAQEFKKYNAYRGQLQELCENMRNNETEIGTDSNGYFRGRVFSLLDQGITEFNYVGELKKEEKDGTVFSDFGIDYRFISGPLSVKTAEELFDRIVQEDYITLIAIKDEASTALTDELVAKARTAGLKFDLTENGFRKSYLAVLDGKTVVHEEMSAQKLEYVTELNGHSISLTSAGYEVGNTASVQVDGVEYALNRRGLNIVFMSQESGEIVDSVCIDSYLDNRVYR